MGGPQTIYGKRPPTSTRVRRRAREKGFVVLSGQQAAVLSYVAAGWRTQDIAFALGISRSTVDTYRRDGLTRIYAAAKTAAMNGEAS